MTPADLIELAYGLGAAYAATMTWQMSKATRRALREGIRREALPRTKRRAVIQDVRKRERDRRAD